MFLTFLVSVVVIVYKVLEVCSVFHLYVHLLRRDVRNVIADSADDNVVTRTKDRTVTELSK